MKYLIIIFAFFFSTTMFCQLIGGSVSGGGVVSGFKYGDQVNSLDQFDNKNKTGLTGGIGFDFVIGSDYLLFSPEIFVVQNGSKEFYSEFGSLKDDLLARQVNLDYLGIYLPFTAYLPMESEEVTVTEEFSGFIFQGKLFADYAVGARLESEFGDTENISFNRGGDKFDFGFSFEAGFAMSGIKLMFGYQWGVNNIKFTESLGNDSDGEYLINNNGLTLKLGYML